MLVVIGWPHSCKFEFSRGLDGMGVVVAKNSLSVGFMQRQAISDSMWNVSVGCHFPCFDFYPVSTFLVNHLIVEFEQCR